MDYFRGKDLYRVFHKMPEVLDEFAPKITGVPTPEDPTDADRVAQVTAIGQEMLRRGFFVRAERVYKEPRPGRSRRPRFPRFLQLVPRAAQQFTDDGEGFYSWTYEQPMTWTSVILSFLVAFASSSCASSRSPPSGSRSASSTSAWVSSSSSSSSSPYEPSSSPPSGSSSADSSGSSPTSARTRFPSTRSSPLWCFDDVDREGKVVGRVPLHKRLFAAGGVGAVLAALYHIAPERGSAIKTIHKAHGSILDLFDLYDTPKGLARNATTQRDGGQRNRRERHDRGGGGGGGGGCRGRRGCRGVRRGTRRGGCGGCRGRRAPRAPAAVRGG